MEKTRKDSLQGINILIADDEEINCILLELYLDGTEANLYFAKNGIEAVEKCKASSIDLILMDIRMPIMNGIEATKEIRKFSKVPVIAVSANGCGIEESGYENLGFDYYIPKPVIRTELSTQILNVLNC